MNARLDEAKALRDPVVSGIPTADASMTDKSGQASLVAMHDFCTGDIVTLHGRTSPDLNSKSGSIMSFNSTSPRYVVKLGACRSLKSIKKSNLAIYSGSGDRETFNACSDEIDLRACPPCACKPSTSTSSSDRIVRSA